MKIIGNSQSAAWEAAYRKKRELWAGTPAALPDLPPGSRVLELGCGNARTFAALVRRGYEPVALDFSRTAVMAAHDVARQEGGGSAILGDARALPVADASCDAVIARHIIGHLTGPDRERVALEIVRVLKPGGTLVFVDFSSEDFRYNRGTRVEEGTFLRGTGIATHYFSEDEVRSLFARLECRSLGTERWEIRVRGISHPRAEIHGLFTR